MNELLNEQMKKAEDHSTEISMLKLVSNHQTLFI